MSFQGHLRKRSTHSLPAGPSPITATAMRAPSARRTGGQATPPRSPIGPQNGYSNGRKMPAFYGHDSPTTLSLSDKYSLEGDPAAWGADLSYGEADDALHTPDPARDRRTDRTGSIFTCRGLANLGCLALLVASIMTLFAGYPIITYVKKLQAGGGLSTVNATGQVPSMAGNWGLIDRDTPQDAYTQASYADGEEWDLVFSDEFNTDGRSFYPGEDPYWEAVDLHYWATGNMEWYDPAAITTSNGSLRITLSEKQTHGLDYQGGMMSSWNKFCFTGGMVETSVMLPGAPNIVGLWPAIWTMGNLGRAGYGATLDGLWPYSYDSCDVGTVVNQSIAGVPAVALNTGGNNHDSTLSYLPGQRLSRCTCPGESHPGPVHSDGTYVGRSAPEIDIFEAQISGTPLTGAVSQSAQWAPFNPAYEWLNTTENMIIPDLTISIMNTYAGGIYQQAASVVTNTNQDCYEDGGTQCYGVYGIEYKPGFDGAYISWIANGKLAWTQMQAGMAANSDAEIATRPISQEPMYLLMNLGQSTDFGTVDTKDMPYPVTMSVDYIRVYQPKDSHNIGCDPPDFPTAAYIKQYEEAYTNPNLTTWVDSFGATQPKNRLLEAC
ncbi:glycoside hydrolase family 16 protein [Athelia psychrophila]|uniref:Glycoside hydrolase family 16 protein n=1 Tax=Athelia psychrophila TaxID=1759441 RepID=A0A166E8Z5_9AGAM|nr:glycoside hydrolase family 16 protein [Fibularhizoctonia sp. CBS 109695]